MCFTLNLGAPKTCSLKTKAFTLIELLVVIAVIALLMAVIIPALKLAKQKAASIVCLANVRQLTACWYMYQDENNGEIVSGNPDDADGWIKHPLMADGVTKCDAITGLVTDEDEQRGIREGKLYPYINAMDVFHCPGDNVRKSKYDQTKFFRSYAVPTCLKRAYIKKYSQISIPSQRYCFVEEAEGRNFNYGTWDFYALNDPGLPSGFDIYWRDPIGIYHGKNGTLGFSDGHAESHKWVDEDTIERVKLYFESSVYGYGFHGGFNDSYVKSGFYDPSQRTDITYMNNGWAYRFP